MTTIILTGIICFLIGILITCAVKDTPIDYPLPKPIHYPSLYCQHCCVDYPHRHYTEMQIKVMEESAYHRGKFDTLNEGLHKFEDKVSQIQNVLDEIKMRKNF